MPGIERDEQVSVMVLIDNVVTDESKRREPVENFKSYRLDVLGTGETISVGR